MLKKTISFPIFAFDVHVCVSSNLPLDSLKVCAGEIDPESPGVTFYTGRESWIFLKEGEFTYGILAHEALHAVNAAMDCIGATPSAKDDEVVAYHMEHVIEETVSWMREENIWIR